MKALREEVRSFRHLISSKRKRNSLTKILALSLALVFGFLTSSPSVAGSNSGSSKENQTIPASPKIPKEYGEVIYRSSGESSKQLYIIGLEHRDTFTRANGINTSKVQAQVYKIGEWLIQNEEVRLLLPEGFFTRKTGKAVLMKSPVEMRPNEPKPMGLSELEKRLANNHTYVNAEMLLKECYECYEGLRVRQVEDKRLYDAVNGALSKMASNGCSNSSDFPSLKSELDYLQGKRVAAMLQKIPRVIAEEFHHQNINNNKAIFTIGLNHLSEIIKFLNNSKIEIHSPLLSSNKNENYSADLNLLKDRFGITVIVPKKLADNDQILKVCRLDKIVGECRNQPSPSSPPKSP